MFLGVEATPPSSHLLRDRTALWARTSKTPATRPSQSGLLRRTARAPGRTGEASAAVTMPATGRAERGHCEQIRDQVVLPGCRRNTAGWRNSVGMNIFFVMDDGTYPPLCQRLDSSRHHRTGDRTGQGDQRA
ncbi:hypothetical protein ACU4GD_29930 [Cupriavidus basilensis]